MTGRSVSEVGGVLVFLVGESRHLLIGETWHVTPEQTSSRAATMFSVWADVVLPLALEGLLERGPFVTRSCALKRDVGIPGFGDVARPARQLPEPGSEEKNPNRPDLGSEEQLP